MTSDFCSDTALRTARYDNAGVGYCAKGTANILEAQGLDVTRGHAYTWKNTLPQNGWIRIEGMRPEDAPEGAVLVFDRSGTRGRGGARYGHVEVVAIDGNGNRKYVSDKARNNWGGSVPQNFVGVYVHPDMMSPQEIQRLANGGGSPGPSRSSRETEDVRLASSGSRETGSFARGLTDLFGGNAGPGGGIDMNGFSLMAVFAIAAAFLGMGGFGNENSPERPAPNSPSQNHLGLG